MSTNFAKTLVWKQDYDVILWRHKQRTPNTNDYPMPLNETRPMKSFCVRHWAHQWHLDWDTPAELYAWCISWNLESWGVGMHFMQRIWYKGKVRWCQNVSRWALKLRKASCVLYGAVVRHRNGKDKGKVYFSLPLYTGAVRRIVFCWIFRRKMQTKKLLPYHTLTLSEQGLGKCEEAAFWRHSKSCQSATVEDSAASSIQSALFGCDCGRCHFSGR